MIDFTYDGHDYRYTFNFETGVLEVFAWLGNGKAIRIASGEYDDQGESFYFDYWTDSWFEETGEEMSNKDGGSSSEIYHNNTPLEAAQFLAGTWWQ